MGSPDRMLVAWVAVLLPVIAACGGGKRVPDDAGTVQDDAGTVLCETDEDCSPEERCVEGSCKPRECETDEDCAFGERCDPATGECVPVSTCAEDEIDKDGDGYVSPGCIDPRTGGFGNDCDDFNERIYPGAEEVCNDSDDNCNLAIDEGFDFTVYYMDGDGDGWGIVPGTPEFRPALVMVRTCLSEEELEEFQGVEYSTLTGDCNDTVAAIHPEAGEECNGIDEDCDGEVDEGVQETFFADRDADNYPSVEVTVEGCEPPAGYMPARDDREWDCYDGEGRVHPGAEEICDGLDNNCNGLADDVDGDGDGYFVCPGVAERDCDDGNPNIRPGATEECNEVDDNCNGLVDEQVLLTFYRDVDGDSFGQDAATLLGCVLPGGYVEEGGDCNDYNHSIHPGATEECNDADDDCDGLVDDGLPLLEVYPDLDGDRYASAGIAPQRDCRVRLGYTTAQDPDGNGRMDWDCHDTDATIYPTAPERCDGKDNDCDGSVDRWCGYLCAGSWPVTLPGDTEASVAVADMNQDGLMEVGVGAQNGMALLAADGSSLWRESGGTNYARRAGVFADIDGVWNGASYSLEWVLGPRSRMTFFRMGADGSISRRESAVEVYDAGTFLARDIDRDGKVEVVVVTWGDRVRIFEHDSASDLLVLQREIPFPDRTAVYTNGISVADADMDTVADVIFGEGYAMCDNPRLWSGRVFSYRVDGSPLAVYETAIASLFGGRVGHLYVHDLDGDGRNEVHAQVYYFRSNNPTICNPADGWRRWTWDGRTAAVKAGPTPGEVQVMRDLDGDRSPEADTFSGWRHDVDGDGDLDSVGIDGSGRVVLSLRSGSTLTAMPPGSVIGSGTLAYLGDLDGDRRLDALFTQAGRVQCVEFGENTFHPWTSADGVPMLGEFVERTVQRDNWEPNETIAGAYFARDDSRLYRGFIAHAGDVDVFRVGTPYCGNATVRAPSTVNLRLRLYGNVDRNGDTLPDLLEEKTVAAGTSQHVSCLATPGSRGLGNYWLEVRSSDGTFSTWDPYVAALDVNY